MNDYFQLSIADGIAHLQLNRPERMNSMSPRFFPLLRDAVQALNDEGQVRVLVISSTGKHFSAGMALDTFASDDDLLHTDTPRARLAFQETLRRLMACFDVLDTVRFPVVCAVQGGCIGGGLDLATACDLRYATEDAFFVIQEINIGMTADVGTLQRLPKLIPDAIVRELAYLGGRMPARRAYEVGLLNGVFASHDELVAGALDTAAQIAAKSPLAIWGSKEMITYARDHTVADALNYIATWQTGMFQPADMMESFLAKAEGRDPVFDDLLSTPDDF